MKRLAVRIAKDLKMTGSRYLSATFGASEAPSSWTQRIEQWIEPEQRRNVESKSDILQANKAKQRNPGKWVKEKQTV